MASNKKLFETSHEFGLLHKSCASMPLLIHTEVTYDYRGTLMYTVHTVTEDLILSVGGAGAFGMSVAESS